MSTPRTWRKGRFWRDVYKRQDVDNPLYFPENNYAYVGDSSQAATAFGKQSDMLVIFHSREMYYATYVAGGDFTAQDVIDGKIVDVTAYMAKFPITQINGEIGCDCPRTVQLCNNRLAWATSDGRVYTPVSYTHLDVYKRQPSTPGTNITG